MLVRLSMEVTVMIKKIINALDDKWLSRLVRIVYETEDIDIEFGWWNKEEVYGDRYWRTLICTVVTDDDDNQVSSYSFNFKEKFEDDEEYYNIDESLLKDIIELALVFDKLKSSEGDSAEPNKNDGQPIYDYWLKSKGETVNCNEGKDYLKYDY